ncbi:YtrH family sporulation protein [Camelliibacillus cellulosilyticus]|uniref:YtrH family sporulation protein n=1 Tax=Camelliibacillus cellulosilyticus TaxID=2174486 RepID=A0ABV9GIY1_9BACL
MDLQKFLTMAIMNFFIAFGVLIGGCLVGGIGAFLASKPPLSELNELVDKLKIWAIVSAIGGTFDTLGELEKGFLEGMPSEVVKHLLLIVAAMTGAHTAAVIIHWLTQEA